MTTTTNQKAMDYSAALKYRRLLWASDEPRDLPESLVEIHNRQFDRMHKFCNTSRLTNEMQAMIVLLWEHTTEEGQSFLSGKEVINWGAINAGSKLVVVIRDEEREAEFVSDATRFQINVRLPGEDKLTRVAKATARLAIA